MFILQCAGDSKDVVGLFSFILLDASSCDLQ